MNRDRGRRILSRLNSLVHTPRSKHADLRDSFRVDQKRKGIKRIDDVLLNEIESVDT